MSLLSIILLAALAESAVSFSGALLAIFGAERMRRLAHYSVSFAVGALLGVSFLELIPEAIEKSETASVLPFVLFGIVLFFIFEKFLFWYHCHGGECPAHPYTYLILWGDFLHNFIDGVILAVAFLADVRLGFLTLTAVLLHELPQEISDFSILVHGGLPKKKALFYNFLVSLSTIAGAALTYAGAEVVQPVLPLALAVVAGNFVYIAAADLIPELHESSGFGHGVAQVLFIIIGIFLALLPDFLFG